MQGGALPGLGPKFDVGLDLDAEFNDSQCGSAQLVLPA
jgi:hypothetical protein